MDASVVANLQRVRQQVVANRRYPIRNLDRVCVRKGGRAKDCVLGRVASENEDFMVVMFDTLREVCVYSNAHTYLMVGTQLRRQRTGSPMGEQISPAKTAGVCLNHEATVMETRETRRGDSVRNLSIGFVDDIHLRVAYSLRGGSDW